MKTLLGIFLGAGFGAVARYALQMLFFKIWPTFPAGTMSVNLLGCFTMGLILSFWNKSAPTQELRGLVGVGILGGFTTFSAFAGESLEMLRRNAYGPAFAYMFGSVLGCITLCALGFALGSKYLT